MWQLLGFLWDGDHRNCIQQSGITGQSIRSQCRYTLSCCDNGGCAGDDNTTVLDYAKNNGLPLQSDYGSPYGPYPDSNKCSVPACAWSPSMRMFKIGDWGFAESSPSIQSIASPASIKAAIMNYGAVGSGIAADDEFEESSAELYFGTLGTIRSTTTSYWLDGTTQRGLGFCEIPGGLTGPTKAIAGLPTGLMESEPRRCGAIYLRA